MNKTEQRELLGPGDFARHLGISRTAFWNWRKAGVVPPANIHHGNVSRWNRAAVNTLTTGENELKTLDPTRLEALADIIRMLRLENVTLKPINKAHLLNLFYSVPYLNRHDPALLVEHLEPALRCLTACDRGEVIATAKGCPPIKAILKTITQKVNTLMV